jgi:hypothetical protein
MQRSKINNQISPTAIFCLRRRARRTATFFYLANTRSQ